MGSSQVEIASSASFGCVLRDHNRRDRLRESNARATQAAFEKNLKNLVRDHLQTCISISSSDSASNENSQKNPIENIDSWVRRNEERNTNPCPKQSPVLDRWNGRQAKENVSTIIEMNTHEAEAESLTVPLNSKREATMFRRPSLAAISNLGASSLVQIWEKRLNKSNIMKVWNSCSSTMACPSRSNSGLSCNEMDNVSPIPMKKESKDSEVVGESAAIENCDAEPIGSASDDYKELQSDRSAPADRPCSSQGRNSDAGDGDRMRVADIIKRLTGANHSQISHSSSWSDDNEQHTEHSSVTGSPNRGFLDQTEHQKVFSQLTCIPRIRGRQAFADLLIRLERDRLAELDSLVERKAVSRFSQRGRIQSLLRLRVLQRGVSLLDKQCPQSAASEVSRPPQGSTIMHLRERFNTSVEPAATSQSDGANLRNNPRKEKVKASVNVDMHHNENSQKQHNTDLVQKQSTAHSMKDDCEVARTNSNALREKNDELQEIREDNKNEELQEIREDNKNEELQKRIDGARNHDLQETCSGAKSHVQETTLEAENHDLRETNFEARNHDLQETCSGAKSHVQETTLEAENHDLRETNFEAKNHDLQETTLEARNHDLQDTCKSKIKAKNNDLQERISEATNNYFDRTVETSIYYDDWDRKYMGDVLEENYQMVADTNYDWFSEISRPRSYWEDLRKQWYKEMHDSGSNNEEIRQMIERRTVSNVLAGDFRLKMDKLVATHIQRQTHAIDNQKEEQDQTYPTAHRLRSFMERHLNSPCSQRLEQEFQEEDMMVEEEEEQEAEETSLISGQNNEATDYFTSSLQTPSPSLLTSWSYRDNEISDDSDGAVSTSPQRHLPSQSYHQINQQCSSPNTRPSIEMELYREMSEQLYREMSELRKSIKDCVSMQMMMQQQFMKREVHSVGKEMSNDGAPKKGQCRICYVQKIDSLLYRCGHMCTCLKCARELQWSSGQCPICEAHIVDVVRAYMES